MAGRVARYFHIDPVQVLDGNYTRLAIRLAAYNVNSARESAEAEAAKRKTG